ncbi:transporter [Paraburkholderia ferrariae]|uniref:transporter n=1 Tax=Paraburkholderia ferrariae TaxID=386056 RepID=UPI0009FE850B|nr:transporter [Paraburkholderia ferrariae]
MGEDQTCVSHGNQVVWQHRRLESGSRSKPLVEIRAGLAGALFVAVLCMSPRLAHAINVDAGDYNPLPPGADVGLLYYEHSRADQINSSGERVSGGDIVSDVGIARFIHFMDVDGFTVDPQILLPFGRAQGRSSLSSLGQTTAVGDAIFAATVWLINRPASQTYFGLTPFIYAPTGNYHPGRELDFGEHRWKFALQAGFTTALTPHILVDLTADATVFTPNNDYGVSGGSLRESPLFQTQAWLRYQLISTLDIRAGFSYVLGGTTTVNGVSQSNRQSTPSWLVGAAWFPAKNWQLMALYGRQTSTENGPLTTQQINFRLLKVF